MDIIKTIKCPLKQILIRKVKYKKFLNLINNSNNSWVNKKERLSFLGLQNIFANGIYQVEITSDNNKVSKKIIITK